MAGGGQRLGDLHEDRAGLAQVRQDEAARDAKDPRAGLVDATRQVGKPAPGDRERLGCEILGMCSRYAPGSEPDDVDIRRLVQLDELAWWSLTP